MNASARPATSFIPRRLYLLQLAGVVVLTGVLLSTMSREDAVHGGVGPKLFLLLRMAFLVLLCTWLLRQTGESWTDLGLRRPRRWWTVPLSVAGGFLLLIVLSMLTTRLLLPAIGTAPPQVSVTPTMQVSVAEYLYWAVAVAWGSAAFGEELLARGFLLDRTAKVLGSTESPALLAAIVVQAAIFGAFHLYQGVGGMLVTGAAGLVLGLVWLGGGRNLWACIILHGTVNFLGASGL